MAQMVHRAHWTLPLSAAVLLVGSAAGQPPTDQPPQTPAVPATSAQPQTPPPATGAAAPPARAVQYSIAVRGEMAMNADFDGGTGDLSVMRGGMGVGLSIPADQRGQVQVGIDYEFSHYRFGGSTLLAGTSTPWEDVHRTELTATYSRQQSAQLSWSAAASAGFSGEEGAGFGDGLFGSVFGGVRYAVSEQFVIGGALAIRSQIEDSPLVVPVPMVRWQISEQWALSSASRPGLRLTYTPWENWTFGLSGEYQFRDFRLAENGPIPGGVGRETRIPIELSVGYAAGKQITLEAAVGYAFLQSVEALDAAGNRLADQDLDGAPFLRFEFGYRF